jgi:hypothetical protein
MRQERKVVEAIRFTEEIGFCCRGAVELGHSTGMAGFHSGTLSRVTILKHLSSSSSTITAPHLKMMNRAVKVAIPKEICILLDSLLEIAPAVEEGAVGKIVDLKYYIVNVAELRDVPL